MVRQIKRRLLGLGRFCGGSRPAVADALESAAREGRTLGKEASECPRRSQGTQRAILIQGDDHLGALVEIHKKLHDAGVRIYASSGVTDGQGRYGYVIYTKEGDHVAAAKALLD